MTTGTERDGEQELQNEGRERGGRTERKLKSHRDDKKSRRRDASESESSSGTEATESSESEELDRRRRRSSSSKRKRCRSSSSKRRSRGRHSDDDGTEDSDSRSDYSSEESESSESESGSEESDSERRRRKRKEKMRREEKERKRRRKREKERKKRKREEGDDKRRKKKIKEKKRDKKKTIKGKGNPGAVTESWGKYGIIREVDMWNKRPEFTAWLLEVKQVNLESLPNWEERKMFKEFMEDYNTATFPSKKYYDLDAHFRAKMEKEMKRGLKKVMQTERTVFNDEEQRRLELQKEREKQKEQQVEQLKNAMQGGMAQAMKEQAVLREEMAYQYKVGNFEAAAAIQRKLDPDAPM